MRRLKFLLVSLAISTFSGCAAYSVMNSDRYYDNGESAPIAHYPPPGKCRIWFQDVPVAEQPGIGNCNELQRHVPDNATLLRG